MPKADLAAINSLGPDQAPTLRKLPPVSGRGITKGHIVFLHVVDRFMQTLDLALDMTLWS
jgi:hypothetical protein